MRWRYRIGFILLVAAAPSACNDSTDRGYVEIKTAFAPVGTDVYLLNAAQLDALKAGHPVDLVLQEPVGSVRLEVQRDGQTIKLCSASVSKDRIVTMLISIVSDRLHCSVE
jgi:hypothetical protein